MDLFANGTPISLQAMLDIRDKRACFQLQQLRMYQNPILSFQCNIPGSIKTSPLIERIFQVGIQQIKSKLENHQLLREWKWSLATGPEYFVSVDCLAKDLKELCIQIEEQGLGRLFDLDVLEMDRTGKSKSISRTELGYESRSCFICGQAAKICSRSRAHELAELYQAMNQLVIETFTDN